MILMAYNRQVCKEFLLPNLHDVDYQIILYREVFGLQQSLEIQLTNSVRGWEILSSDTYYVKYQRMREERHLLCDKEILEIKTYGGEFLQLIVVDDMFCFPVAEKYDISRMKEISIGKSEGNLIRYNFMELVSSFHGTLERHQDGWYLRDLSSNGLFLSDRRIQGVKKLRFGDHIEIFGLHVLFLDTILAVETFYGELTVKEDILKPVEIAEVLSEKGEKRMKGQERFFNRSPRNLPTIYKESVEIEAPPNPKNLRQKPIYLTIGPAFTMAIPMMLGCGFAIFGSRLSGYTSSAFMYTGLVTAIGSALIGVVWAFLNMNYARKENREEENQRYNAYSNYLMQMTEKLRRMYRHNAAAMNEIYPLTAQVLSYNRNSSSLWNRNHNHEDFLYQRLGNGEQPFQVDIMIPKDKFTLINDSLTEKPKMIKEEFQTLKEVPVGISLMEHRLIGLVGGENKEGAIEMMHTLVAGIAAAHSYTDVKLVFIYREYDRERQMKWECMRWFPHVWSEDKRTRYMASDEIEMGDIFFELSNVIRARSQEENSFSQGKKRFTKPHYVMFISDPALLEGEILTKYIYDARPEYGITTFLMVESVEQLPNTCEEVIENHRLFHGVYNLMNTDVPKKTFIPDQVECNALERFGQVLANIRVNEIESSSEIPSALDFLQMYGVNSLEELQIAERWRKNRTYNSMRALIGKKAGNADCYLDIHEKFHGPHGLVAGTTGSGKSETLQTYILSLAVNFSPEDVSFFIIDFKGGGMANLFSNLPHLSGQISNLSGNQVHRAMISIKSENQRRQRIFSEHGVNNINLYTRLYKNHEARLPVPHLFIIIDEFAELKREEPDFMRELISVAQVGRSLGVHLILATQKPSGTVDDNIWSNSRFRLCLRVQDRQDSNDMLHKPDAAFITQAGRCYMQVGNDEIYELFQSGYSGAIYQKKDEKIHNAAALLTRTGKAELVGSRRGAETYLQGGKKTTQLEAVIAHLQKSAAENGYAKSMQLWLPVLEKEIYLAELEGYEKSCYHNGIWNAMPKKWSLETMIGLCDDPKRQMQKPLTVSLSNGGHTAICGSVVSGKSTFLQTLVYSFLQKYTPEVLQMYLLDFSSRMLAPFEGAPHVGGIVFDNQEERLAKFMFMLVRMMEERKFTLQGGNYSQYVQAYGIRMPAIMVVIDNVASFREKTKNKYDDILLRLAREGVGYGIYLIVSAAGFGISEIPSRIADNIRTVISLEQADKFKYMEVLRMTRVPILPEVDVRGRGLALVDGEVLEFQTALCVPAEDGFERGLKIERCCEDMSRHWMGACARSIPEIPEKPVLEDLHNTDGYREMVRSKNMLPFGYRMEDASVYGISLAKTYCYFISGKKRTGKTNALKVLLCHAFQKEGQLCVIENDTNELKTMAKEMDACYVENAGELFSYFEKLLPEFSVRNKRKQELLAHGLDEQEIFEQMKEFLPIFIFVADMEAFCKMVYKPGEGIGNMSGFVENILEKGSLHNIYFIACLKAEDEGTLPMYRGYTLFTSYKTGIHLGGNFQAQKIFQFQNLNYAQQSKVLKRGIGYVPDEEEESIGVEVVIPMAKNSL